MCLVMKLFTLCEPWGHGGGFQGLYPEWKHFCLLCSGHYETGTLGNPKWIGGQWLTLLKE